MKFYHFRRCFQTGQKSLAQVLTKVHRIKHENFYKQIDRVPPEYEMIYKFSLNYTMHFTKAIATATPVAFFYCFCTEAGFEPVEFYSSLYLGDQWPYLMAGLAIHCVMAYRFCDKLTLRIYRHGKSYVFITFFVVLEPQTDFQWIYLIFSYIAMQPGMIPRRDKKVYFEAGQVREHFNAFSLFRGLCYKINNKSVILSPQRFRKSVDLYNMLDSSDSKKYLG